MPAVAIAAVVAEGFVVAEVGFAAMSTFQIITAVGAITSAVGMVTGNKELTQIGGLMSLAGGAGQMVSSLSTAASAAPVVDLSSSAEGAASAASDVGGISGASDVGMSSGQSVFDQATGAVSSQPSMQSGLLGSATDATSISPIPEPSSMAAPSSPSIGATASAPSAATDMGGANGLKATNIASGQTVTGSGVQPSPFTYGDTQNLGATPGYGTTPTVINPMTDGAKGTDFMSIIKDYGGGLMKSISSNGLASAAALQAVGKFFDFAGQAKTKAETNLLQQQYAINQNAMDIRNQATPIFGSTNQPSGSGLLGSIPKVA